MITINIIIYKFLKVQREIDVFSMLNNGFYDYLRNSYYPQKTIEIGLT